MWLCAAIGRSALRYVSKCKAQQCVTLSRFSSRFVKMGDKMLVEQIIDTIKKHPVLYDSTLPYRKDLKEALWEEIADTFDIDVHILKVKWKNLRDCYKKHLRAQNDNSKVVSSYKFWHWSKTLEFLRPHLRSNPEITYGEETDDDNVKNHSDNTINVIKLEDHSNFASDSEVAECIVNQHTKLFQGKHSEKNSGSDSDNVQSVLEQSKHWKRRRLMSNSNANDVPSHSRTGMNEFDGIELIFLGYAKTVKNMPLKRQISVKMKIAKIIMEEELKCLE